MELIKYFNINILFVLKAAILLFIGVSTSHADSGDRGFLVGASAGYADHKDNCDEVFGQSCDEKDLGWKVFAGYRINKHFSLEAGSVDFGQAEAEVPFVNVNTLEVVVATLETKVDGYFLSGLAEWPINNKFSVLAKLGVIYWDIEFKGSGLPGNGELVGDEDENGTDFFYGFGAQYKLTENFALRAEWERFNNVGESGIDLETDIDLFSSGFVMQF